MCDDVKVADPALFLPRSTMAQWLESPFLTIGFSHYIITFCVCIIVFVVVMKIARTFQDNRRLAELHRNNSTASGLCEYSECVRCRRHDEVLLRARTRLSYCDDQDGSSEIQKSSAWLSLLKDIETSKCKLTSVVNSAKEGGEHEHAQNPLVLQIKGLQAKPEWNVEDFPGLHMLSEQFYTIKSEFCNMFQELASNGFCSQLWKVNDTPSGRWMICHLLDQGRATDAVSCCPVTWKTITSLPSAVTGNLFGNAAFSVMEPGTTVSPHFGPTNIRIRCHLGLLCSICLERPHTSTLSLSHCMPDIKAFAYILNFL